MVRFTILFFLMLILFLGGVIVGFDQAGKGMNKIRGDNVDSYDAVKTIESDNDNIEVEVLGQSIEQLSLGEKRLDYQKVKESHFTEKVATTVEKGVKWVYNKMIESVYQLTEKIYRM
ncbi:DUF3679 domain-containing protein [Salirhabdus salicampi]|uniref:DUF3679 domain-containing protein n=1 Tax=Salirhabdus salicampi TaxID=476102 RepID=UPI0020C3FBA8|nr:DUF3679 domain-containing protein [Salirhabdus salicampi]MCP8616919.1 YqxA family protein [Salirhabdus salicampi]